MQQPAYQRRGTPWFGIRRWYPDTIPAQNLFPGQSSFMSGGEIPGNF